MYHDRFRLIGALSVSAIASTRFRLSEIQRTKEPPILRSTDRHCNQVFGTFKRRHATPRDATTKPANSPIISHMADFFQNNLSFVWLYIAADSSKRKEKKSERRIKKEIYSETGRGRGKRNSISFTVLVFPWLTDRLTRRLTLKQTQINWIKSWRKRHWQLERKSDWIESYLLKSEPDCPKLDEYQLKLAAWCRIGVDGLCTLLERSFDKTKQRRAAEPSNRPQSEFNSRQNKESWGRNRRKGNTFNSCSHLTIEMIPENRYWIHR